MPLPPIAKIICTLGPSTDSLAVLRRMARAGMAVARLNFSHGSHASHAARLRLIARLNEHPDFFVRVLQDLEGHRIRIDALDAPRLLAKGQVVRLGRLKASRDAIPLDYDGTFVSVRRGGRIFIDDGKIMLTVLETGADVIRARVVVGGELKQRKGVNIPGFRFPRLGLTTKDEADLVFGIRNRVDFVAQSFVRNASDVRDLKARIDSARPRIRIIAKIESTEGIRNIDEILPLVDGVMIARGDMGVSIPIYRVPMVQKAIIRKCNRMKKFAVTATQMLESMTENPWPTRAEVSDVANAYLDGSDYLMLSGETAVGKHPVATIRMMRQTLDFTRKSVVQLGIANRENA